MSVPIVTIFGGSGLIGRQVAQRMARAGWRVRVAVRRPEEAGFVRPYGFVGQVEPIQANIRDEASTRAAIVGATAVVNCTGILSESGKQTFGAVLDEGPARIARLAAEAGVENLVHFSAIGADPASASAYAAGKGRGEAAVLAAFPSAVILRPSVVFGDGDGFFNKFAGIARISPVVPVVGADTRFQPVYVGDVAHCFVHALSAEITFRARYDLCGPRAYTLRELVTYAGEATGAVRPILTLGPGLSRLQATVLEHLPGKLMSRDNVLSMQADNVCSCAFPSVFGIEPAALEAVAPQYLAPTARRSAFDALRAQGGR